MGYPSIITRACLAGFCLFLLCFHTQCATEKTGFTLQGKILSTIDESIGTVNLDCETTAKIDGEVVLNFGSIHRDIPIGVDGMPLNGSVLNVLDDATIKENCDDITFEIACTPSASSLVSVEAINAMVGQANLNPCDCQGDCLTQVPLESIFNTQLALDAVCPIAQTVYGIFTFQCLAGFENSDLWCVALTVLGSVLDCDFPAVDIPSPGGNGGGTCVEDGVCDLDSENSSNCSADCFCGDGIRDGAEECDNTSGDNFGGCNFGAGGCYGPGSEDECTCICMSDPSFTELCDSNCDDDADGMVDCNDPDCFDEFPCGGPVEICDDEIDNDMDGFTDCDDPKCFVHPVCLGACCAPGTIQCSFFGPGILNPNDCAVPCETGNGNPGTTDCRFDSLGDGSVIIPIDETEGACTGTDPAPFACTPGSLVCGANVPANCVIPCDGNLNCGSEAPFLDELFCGCETRCNDGQDNNGNSLIDCDDPDCLDDPACGESIEICDDEFDNDEDGAFNCNDADCVGDPACPNDCGTGITCNQAENKVITEGGICLNLGSCCSMAVGSPITCRDGCCEDL